MRARKGDPQSDITSCSLPVPPMGEVLLVAATSPVLHPEVLRNGSAYMLVRLVRQSLHLYWVKGKLKRMDAPRQLSGQSCLG